MNYLKKKWAIHKPICVRPFYSHDYQQQRSFTSTSTSIEPINDNTNDKRDIRRPQHQRTNSSRQQPYSGQNPSSATNNPNERTYTRGIVFLLKFLSINLYCYLGSTSQQQQQSKYGSNQKVSNIDNQRYQLMSNVDIYPFEKASACSFINLDLSEFTRVREKRTTEFRYTR